MCLMIKLTDERVFLIISNTVDVYKPVNVKSLTQHGRLDVLCRSISSVFYLSDNFRTDSILNIFFKLNNLVLTLEGNSIRNMSPDEKSIAGILKKVFSGSNFPGVQLKAASFEDFLNTLVKPALLHINGEDLGNDENIRNFTSFILGDQEGISLEMEKMLVNIPKIRIGQHEYLSSQCITIINYLKDTKE